MKIGMPFCVSCFESPGFSLPLFFQRAQMATPTSESLYEVSFSLQDPHQSGKVQHGLAETLVMIVFGLLVGADTLVEIEFWAKQKQDWLQQHLRLPHGIPSPDTMGQLLSQIDPREFAAAFQRWVHG